MSFIGSLLSKIKEKFLLFFFHTTLGVFISSCSKIFCLFFKFFIFSSNSCKCLFLFKKFKKIFIFVGSFLRTLIKLDLTLLRSFTSLIKILSLKINSRKYLYFKFRNSELWFKIDVKSLEDFSKLSSRVLG